MVSIKGILLFDKSNILDAEAIRIIREMKKFRNYLVHKYDDVDDAKAYRDIKEGLKDFEVIVNEIEEFLNKHSGKK